MRRGGLQRRAPVRCAQRKAAGARASLIHKPGLTAFLLSAVAAWVLCLALSTSASAAPPQTRTVTTGSLQMTGLGGGAATVTLTTGPLQMIGLGSGSTEVRLTSGALQMTGLGATGTGVRVTTGELRMTGFGL